MFGPQNCGASCVCGDNPYSSVLTQCVIFHKGTCVWQNYLYKRTSNHNNHIGILVAGDF